MSKLINLKAFIKDQNKIVYVTNVNFSTGELAFYNGDAEVEVVNVDDVTVLIGSNFKDVHDVEIFEGDLLSRLDILDDEVFVVERHGYSNNLFLKKKSTGTIFNIELFVGKELEIIGNIYNPG